MKKTGFLTLLIFIFILLILTSGARADEIALNEWLVLGPVHIPAIVFADDNITEQILDNEILDSLSLKPAESEPIEWYPEMTFKWTKFNGTEIELPKSGNTPEIAYIAAYINTSRRQDVTINAITPFPAALYVNGEKQDQVSTPGTEEAPNLLTAVVDLHTGKHTVIIKTVNPGGIDTDWNIEVTAYPEFDESDIYFTTDRKEYFTEYHDYIEIAVVSNSMISPDGTMTAVLLSKRDREILKSHRWIEVYSTRDGELITRVEMGKSVSSPVFSQMENDILFFKYDGGLWKCELSTGAVEEVYDDLEGAVKFDISPDTEFIYYTKDGDRKVYGKDDYTLQTTLEERLTDWYTARKLYVASLKDGTCHELSALGDYEINDFGLSPEGNKIIFTRRIASPGRPYMDTEFWLLDLKTGDCEMLMSRKIPFETRPQNLTMLPGGEFMVYTSASYYTDDPASLPKNLSEVDIWLLNLNTKEEQNLTLNTPFTVDENGGSHGSLFWNQKQKRLYFPGMVGGCNKLYSLDPFKLGTIREESLPYSYIKNISFSDDGRKMAYTSEGLNQTRVAALYDFKAEKSILIKNPNNGLADNYELCNYDSWNFENRLGYEIDGWILYPPDFDPEKKYPMIVYYYAGVWMLDESFYYTYQFWAANGYIVYALTPVGAMAHGDDFSAYHVNDWGTEATQDIIEGVSKLVSEKSFIDADKIGCYGGSYGGFTTMDLVTKTDIFACAVSMYGISNIASYWGGGIWGYTYGDIALANSYPWKDKDLFTNKSPLFNADKINTPLLLLHGLDDVNVPALESDQMFTALRVQDKEVSYVKFEGEGHGIAGKFENYETHREMMLEWFDRYLKDQPEGWNRRFN